MLELAGAMLVLSASTLAGFDQASRYARRPQQIRQWILILQRMETEIVYGFTPLPTALERLSHTVQGPIREMLAEVAGRLQTNRGETTRKVWQEVIGDLWHKTSLNKADKEIILQLGSTLGTTAGSDQTKHLRLALNHLEQAESSAAEDRNRYEKMWRSLGVLVGALIVILMI